MVRVGVVLWSGWVLCVSQPPPTQPGEALILVDDLPTDRAMAALAAVDTGGFSTDGHGGC